MACDGLEESGTSSPWSIALHRGFYYPRLLSVFCPSPSLLHKTATIHLGKDISDVESLLDLMFAEEILLKCRSVIADAFPRLFRFHLPLK